MTQVRWQKAARYRHASPISTFPFADPIGPGQREYGGHRLPHSSATAGQAIIQAATGIGKTLAALCSRRSRPSGEGRYRADLFSHGPQYRQSLGQPWPWNMLQESAGMRLKRVFPDGQGSDLLLPSGSRLQPRSSAISPGGTSTGCPTVLMHGGLRAHDQPGSGDHRIAWRRNTGSVPSNFLWNWPCWADCLVCDYNYAFDPRVYLRRFFDEENGRLCLFLVDEAHNLVDRSRDMFSAAIK